MKRLIKIKVDTEGETKVNAFEEGPGNIVLNIEQGATTVFLELTLKEAIELHKQLTGTILFIEETGG